MNITRICPFTNRVNVRFVEGATPEALAAWKNGKCIQDCMPEVSPEGREFIMSGITPEMWERVFGGEEA